MIDFTSQSGASVSIRFAGFEKACNLKEAIALELAKTSINFDISASKTLDDLLDQDITSELINTLKTVVFTLIASKKVRKACFECLKYSTYNDEKITEGLFNNEDTLQDYYEIVINCLKVNVCCFFAKPLTRLMHQAEEKKKKQKSQK